MELKGEVILSSGYISRFSTALIRIGEYVRAFGLSGVRLSLFHFLGFKLRGRGIPVATAIPGFGKIYLRPRTSDLATFREIFINGEYDARRHGLFDVFCGAYYRILADGRTPLIIDAGGNIGLASVFMSHLFPNAEIMLIEASRENAKVARLNSQGRAIKIVEAALWDRAGTVNLSISKDASTHRVNDASDGGARTVSAITMGELVLGRESDLFLVKMDIEGAEIRVLPRNGDGRDWLESAPIFMIEPHDASINAFGSLSGLLERENYRSGMIVVSGSTMMFVPQSQCNYSSPPPS